MKCARLLAICLCFCSGLPSDPIALAQKKKVAPISGQTLKGMRIAILAVTRMNQWRSKTPSEDGDYIVFKAKEGQEIVVVRVKITVMKETDAIGLSPVEMHDTEGNKIGPLAFFWKSGKFSRGYTIIQEFLFRAPRGTRFKTFQAEDVQLNVEKLEGRGSN